jgi:hypothetical protein
MKPHNPSNDLPPPTPIAPAAEAKKAEGGRAVEELGKLRRCLSFAINTIATLCLSSPYEVLYGQLCINVFLAVR